MTDYDFVEPWMMLGAATVRSAARRLGAHIIISLSDDEGWPRLEGIPEQHHYVLDDAESVSEAKVHAILNRTTKILKDAEAARHTVIVHCVAGISRSTTVVLDYLMSRDKITYAEALAKVKQARPHAKPNDLFQAILQERHA